MDLNIIFEFDWIQCFHSFKQYIKQQLVDFTFYMTNLESLLITDLFYVIANFIDMKNYFDSKRNDMDNLTNYWQKQISSSTLARQNISTEQI